MAKKKNKKASAPMPPFPMPPAPVFPVAWDGDGQEEVKAKAKEIKSNLKTAWEKSIDMQKASVDGSKDQFNQFFAYLMDIQDSFADTLPEELPVLPGLPEIPVSPKAVMKTLQELEELFNEYLVGQKDARMALFFEVQQKAIDAIPEAKAEDEEPAEAEEAEEAKAEDAE